MNDHDSNDEKLYQDGWKDLQERVSPVQIPDTSGVSQQLGLIDRCHAVIGRGLLVALAIVFCSQYQVFSSLQTLSVSPALARLSSYITVLLSVLFIGTLVRFSLKYLVREIPSYARYIMAGLLLLSLSGISLLLQGALSFLALFKLAGQAGGVDDLLLIIDSLTFACFQVKYWQGVLCSAALGGVALEMTQVYLKRFAPWQPQEEVPRTARLLVAATVVMVLLSGAKFTYDLGRGMPMSTEVQRTIQQSEDQVETLVSLLRAVRNPAKSYRGNLSQMLSKLSVEKMTKEESQDQILELVDQVSDEAAPSLDLFLASWWTDEKLGFDHRTYSPELSFEQEIVPQNLLLWKRLKEVYGAEVLWEVRHTGTLFALSRVVAAPSTELETLREIDALLSDVRLSPQDLRGHFVFQVLSERPRVRRHLNKDFLYPAAALNRTLGLVALEAVLEGGHPTQTESTLEAFDKYVKDVRLGELREERRDFRNLTLRFGALFDLDDLDRAVSLPAQLTLCRVAVKMRLHYEKVGSYPALEEVEDAESHQLQLNGHTLRMVGLHRDFSLDLP